MFTSFGPCRHCFLLLKDTWPEVMGIGYVNLLVKVTGMSETVIGVLATRDTANEHLRTEILRVSNAVLRLDAVGVTCRAIFSLNLNLCIYLL